MASSRPVPEFCPAASPLVRASRLRLAPARRNAYSRPPRSADSCPGRAVTASTETALGSDPAADSLGGLGRGMAGVVVIVLSCRGRLPGRWPRVLRRASCFQPARAPCGRCAAAVEIRWKGLRAPGFTCACPPSAEESGQKRGLEAETRATRRANEDTVCDQYR